MWAWTCEARAARVACKAGVFCSAIHDVIPPSWTLILPECWDESKTDIKGEVDGYKIEEGEGEEKIQKIFSPLSSPPLPPFPPHLSKSFPWLFKMAAEINVPLSLARVALRLFLRYAKAILRKKRTVLQSQSFEQDALNKKKSSAIKY